MKHYLIADRYARSLDSAIQEDGELDSALEVLREISTLFSDNHELHSVLANPAIAVEKRVAVLHAILDQEGVAPVVKLLMATVIRRGRIAVLPDLTELFSQRVDRRLQRVSARVTSALALSEEQSQKITASLEKFSGKRVRVHHTVDPDILGGIIARIGGKIIDGSVRARIERLKQSLLPEENLGG